MSGTSEETASTRLGVKEQDEGIKLEGAVEGL